MSAIRIIARPAGEAPAWVRNAWIGVVLETKNSEPCRLKSLGVLSGPASTFGQFWAIITGRTIDYRGYVVIARDAIDRLETEAPEAAKWWRTNTPTLLSKNRELVFEAEVCELVEQ